MGQNWTDIKHDTANLHVLLIQSYKEEPHQKQSYKDNNQSLLHSPLFWA